MKWAVMFFVIHIICCVLVWMGIKTKILKVKKYLMLPVIFVPFWGVLCVLILHFQLFAGAGNIRKSGVEKLKVNEEIYKNIFAPETENEQNLVPLEDALLLNEQKIRRELIMDVLNDNPGEYMELLEKARMNDDVEVVHYAITAMVELSKDYDERLQKLERRYAAAPDDPQILDEYCEFMEEYLGQGLLEDQMEQMQRNQYTQLLKKKLKKGQDLHTSVCLVENLLKLGDYTQAGEILEQMNEKWHRREEYWVLYIKFCSMQKMGKEIRNSLKKIEEEHIYLSSKGKEGLAFWLDSYEQ